MTATDHFPLYVAVFVQFEKPDPRVLTGTSDVVGDFRGARRFVRSNGVDVLLVAERPVSLGHTVEKQANELVLSPLSKIISDVHPMKYSEPAESSCRDIVGNQRVPQHPPKGWFHRGDRTMVNSEPSELEGIGIKDGVEQAILLHSWTQTDECPECGCTSTLLIGPETASEERLVEVVDCKNAM